jgi:signal transduction histidine kinase
MDQLAREVDRRVAETIGALAAGVAHDFNNLLLSIMGNASMAREMLPDSAPIAGLLESIIQSSRQGADLTRQMLAYAGAGRVVVEPVNLSELARETAASLSPMPELRFHLDPRLPSVRADRRQLQHVLSGLLRNAAEAIGGRPGIVTVKTGVRHLEERHAGRLRAWAIQAGPCVCLEVGDNGCGMDRATRARAFDPFFTTKFTGRGLGLAAASGIVRAHGGAILVTSAAGKGSRFRVLLPIDPER